jgi:hypothetical protein
MAERGGFFRTTENKPLTSIDPDFSIKNGTIFDPKCNRKCNQPSETIARDRRGLHPSWGDFQTRKPKSFRDSGNSLRNRTRVRSLGSLRYNSKTRWIGSFFAILGTPSLENNGKWKTTFFVDNGGDAAELIVHADGTSAIETLELEA